MSFQKPQSHSVEAIVYEVPALAERICKGYETIRIIGIDGFTGGRCCRNLTPSPTLSPLIG